MVGISSRVMSGISDDPLKCEQGTDTTVSKTNENNSLHPQTDNWIDNAPPQLLPALTAVQPCSQCQHNQGGCTLQNQQQPSSLYGWMCMNIRNLD